MNLLRARDAEAEARLQEGDLIVEAEQRDGRLRKLIEERLPEVDLPELLIEVDGWAGFTSQLTPLSRNRSRSSEMPGVLYAAIIAQATNLGLTGMARASDYSYQQLEWACDHYCREQTLTAATASLVDYHHQLPLTQTWGSGQLSSSDGKCASARPTPTASSRITLRPEASISSAASLRPPMPDPPFTAHSF